MRFFNKNNYFLRIHSHKNTPKNSMNVHQLQGIKITLLTKVLARATQFFRASKASVLPLLPHSRTALQPPKATATVFYFSIDF